MSCDHCGCAQVLHRSGRDECESCSCIQYLDAEGKPLPSPANEPRGPNEARSAEQGPRFIEYRELTEAYNRFFGGGGDSRPQNLDMPEKFQAAGILPGMKLHLGVVGNHLTDEAVFVKKLIVPPPVVAQDYMEDRFVGIVVRLAGREHELEWDDILECWPVPEEVDPRYPTGHPPRP